MIPYILHTAVVLTVCFLFYKLVLQKATFYRLNRWTLFICLMLSFALPLLPAPRGWAWNPATASQPIVAKPVATAATPIGILPDAKSQKMNDHHLSTNPIREESAAGVAENVDLQPAAVSPHPPTVATLPATTAVPWQPLSALLPRGLALLTFFYCLSLVVFGLKFILQIVLLCHRSFTRPVIRDGRYRIVQTSDDRGPRTFANTIFINPSLYGPETYRQILVHEKIHVNGGHTLDILLAELAVVFQWFNPFVWWYRREVENNLEFLTDRSVLEDPEIERLSYQLSLLRVSAPHLPLSITNNYNQSLLKRRIVMMNSQHSARHAIWRYFLLLPILTVLVCTLNKPAALGQSAVANVRQRQTTAASRAIVVDTVIHPFSAAAGKAGTAAISAPPTTSLDPQVVTINGTFTSIEGTVATLNGTISVQSPTHASTGSAPSNAVTAAIPDTSVPHTSNDNDHFSETTDIRSGAFFDMRQGSWFLTVDSDDMEFELRAESGENHWRTTFTVKKSEINPYPGQGNVEFRLVRDAGTMIFKGSFDGERGIGRFQFQPDESYFDELKKMGVKDMDEHAENIFFVLNIGRGFVRMLNRDGYTPIGKQDVVSLAIHNVDEPFLKYWKSSGVEGADEVHNLFMLKILKIDPAYVDGLKNAGYNHLTVGQLIRLKRLEIDGDYVREMSAGDSVPATPDELLLNKMMHIDPAYLKSLKKVGYDHLNQFEIRQLYNAHVTADYIKGFQDAGFLKIPAQNLVMLKMQNASPEDAKGFRSVGYTDLDLERITQLKRQGITPDFVNAFHKIGYENIPVGTLFMLKISGVDADYVAKMKRNGLNSPDLMKYVQLKREFN